MFGEILRHYLVSICLEKARHDVMAQSYDEDNTFVTMTDRLEELGRRRRTETNNTVLFN